MTKTSFNILTVFNRLEIRLPDIWRRSYVRATINAGGVRDLELCRIAHIQAGQVLGEMALLEDRTRSEGIRAGSTGTAVRMLARRRLEGLIVNWGCASCTI